MTEAIRRRRSVAVLRRSGLSIRRIARDLEVPPATVYKDVARIERSIGERLAPAFVIGVDDREYESTHGQRP